MKILSFKSLSLLALVIAAIAVGACSSASSGDRFSLTVSVKDKALDGTVAYLVNYDTDEKVDSTVVSADTVRFNSVVTKPYLARVIIGGQRAGIAVIEKGNISRDSSETYIGTPLNDTFAKALKRVDKISNEARRLPEDSIGAVKLDSLNKVYDAFVASMVKENASNPVGYYFFMQSAYEMSLSQLDAALKEYPDMAEYTRVKNLRVALEKKARTAPGAKYIDFSVKNDSVTRKLSDYVGVDGKLTLVDFWASWCGPCRREIPVIKSLLEKYGKKDLNVVGVAVWDEAPATRKAIEELGITWPNIIDAQRIPTDIYGISGIPCIMIIGPDGTILSRDKTDKELVAAVDSLVAIRMNTAAAEGDKPVSNSGNAKPATAKPKAPKPDATQEASTSDSE